MPTTRETLNSALGALLCTLIVACGGGAQEPAPQEPLPTAQSPSGSPPGGVAAHVTPLPRCCDTYEELVEHDGERVQIRGVYTKTNVSRRPSPLDLGEPGTAMVTTGTTGVMLEIYYREEGMRSLEEIQRFHDKAVIVTGTLHRRTPSQTHEGVEMQTMIGPYVEVESLHLAPSQR